MIARTPASIEQHITAAAIALCGDGATDSVLHHALALLLLKRFDRLPPHQQSLTTIARNLNNALLALERTDTRLAGLSAFIDFRTNTNGEEIQPKQLRSAVAYFSDVYVADGYCVAKAAEQFLQRNTRNAQLPLNAEKVIARLLDVYNGYSVLDMNPHVSLRLAEVLESTSHQAFSTGDANIQLFAVNGNAYNRTLATMMSVLNNSAITWVQPDEVNTIAENATMYDRILHDCTDTLSIRAVASMLSERGAAVLTAGEEAITANNKQELQWALENDILECVVRIAGVQQQIEPLYLLVLRINKPLHTRQRVLFINDESEVTHGNARLIDEESIEQILGARELFITQGTYCAVVPRNKLTSQDFFPEPRTYTEPKRKTDVQSPSLFGGIPHEEFTLLCNTLDQHGVDVRSYFVDSLNGFIDFAPAFVSKSLIRVAIASAPTLKNQETRMHYTFAHWWYRNEPFITGLPVTRHEVEASFTEALAGVGLLDAPAVKAVFARWWNAVSNDVYVMHSCGATELVESWLGKIEIKASAEGNRFWQHLTDEEEYLLQHLAPAVLRRVRTSTTTLGEIEALKSTVQFNGAERVVESMRRRREEQLASEVHDADVQAEVISKRITELQRFVAEQKQRIAELHKDAKDRQTLHDSKELFDSTVTLQDELGNIIAALVPAQSELRMLEQAMKPYSDLQARIEHERTYIERITNQVPQAFSIARKALSTELATTLALDILREKLTVCIESRLTINRERIITKLEQWWDDYASHRTSIHKKQHEPSVN
ncbi:MAG: hypothetical protein U0Y96_16530 [Candidatus Kapaibacterium sp.]